MGWGQRNEPGRANAVEETPTVYFLDHRMAHVTPLVAQEVEKGCMTGVRLESTPSGYPVIDKSWADGLSPCEVPFKGDPELLAVRQLAEKVGKDVEGKNKLGGRLRKGKQKGVDERSKRVDVYWLDKQMGVVERSVSVDKMGGVNFSFRGGEMGWFERNES